MTDQTAARSAAELHRMKFAFLDAVEPLRPGLWKYCRSLTGCVWDAEDLLQDTLLRAFAKMGEVHGGVRDLRAYLHRVATNAWIDAERRVAPEPLADDDLPDAAAPEVPPAPEIREALAELTRRLPPQERVAVLLKDVFDFSLDETARALGTSVGAVKAALHRGRGKLSAAPLDARDCAPPPRRTRAAEQERVTDAMAAAFNAKDVRALLALMLPTGETHLVGVGHDIGESESDGTFARTAHDPELLRAERAEVGGEFVVLLWYPVAGGGQAVGDVLRCEAADGACARVFYYYFCPELIEEVGRELGVPVTTHGCTY